MKRLHLGILLVGVLACSAKSLTAQLLVPGTGQRVVKVGDTWERRELPASETVWCLDSPKDAVVEGFLIFSDHDQRPGAITRPWSITAEEAGCGSQVGTLSYSFLDSAPASGWSGSSMSEDATIQVKLKADPDLGGYVNDGSTYGAHSFSHVVLPPGPDGCSPIIDSTGIGGGTLEQEVISAGPYQDDAEEWHLTLGSISLPVHFEVDESWCSAGSGNHSDDGSMLVPVCEGDALTTTDEATWTFVFDCDFQGETQAWSMSGSIIVNRSD